MLCNVTFLYLRFLNNLNSQLFDELTVVPHGSVVRTSVFDWRIFPDLRLTCDFFVGKVSATGQPTRPIQPSIPSGSVNE